MPRSKAVAADLALFGGAPLFGEPRHVGRPLLGDTQAFHRRLDAVLARKQLSNHGPEVRELEHQLAARLGVDHCICVANGTIGLMLVAMALGIKGEVIVPSYTFAATAHSLKVLGISPVFCDVDARTHGADPASVAALIGPRTAAIIGVHLWGNPCDVVALRNLAAASGIPLYFDAAHAFGSRWNGDPIGRAGRASVLSFHATKAFNTAEGGAVITSDADLAERIRRMVAFGFSGYDHVTMLGINGKMSELSAALGLANLPHVSEFVETNRTRYLAYRRGLGDVPGLTVLEHTEDNGNFHYVVARVDADLYGVTRDALVDLLWAERVLARRYFTPGCHRMAPYASSAPGARLPVTEALSDSVVVLPTGSQMSDSDIAQVTDVIRLIAREATEVSRLLALRDDDRRSA